MSLLLLNEDELRQIVTMSEAIDAVKAAFSALAEGRIDLPGDFSLKLPEKKGEVQVQGTYLKKAPYYMVKVSSYFQDNIDLNLPNQSGLTCVFDADTGFPAAIMVDNGYLAMIRCAAAGALAADYLANHQLAHVAVIGSGYPAYMQLKALMTVRTVRSVSVWAPSRISADNYALSMIEEYDVDVNIAPSIEAAVRPADLIITASGSQQPLVKAEWLKPGVHITSVGCNGLVKQELHVDVLARADVIITDRFSQCAAFGEISHGLAAGLISKADVQGELGDLIIGAIPGRTDAGQITLADLTGLDGHDTVVATHALQKAKFLGLGQRVAEPSLVKQL
jgi:ornithine cyclodeaminase/alanine dehydrogenase-like protein (mu-crystallin family)